MSSKEKKRKRMRMTMPKKQEDLEKVVEEVMEIHPEMAHEHEHEHVHGLEDVLSAVEVIIDSFNTRLREVERRVEDLASEVATLYTLNAKLFEVVLTSNPDRRKKALREAIELLEKQRNRPMPGN